MFPNGIFPAGIFPRGIFPSGSATTQVEESDFEGFNFPLTVTISSLNRSTLIQTISRTVAIDQ